MESQKNIEEVKRDGRAIRLANLRPSKKGEVRNPHGRPKKLKCIPDLLNWAGGLTCPEKLAESMKILFGVDGKLTVEQALILRSMAAGLKGDIKHIEFWAERTEGKPVQPIDMNVEPPLTVVLHPPPGQGKT